MSNQLPARQQLTNTVVPLICFSIAVVLFAFAGRELFASLLEEDPEDASVMQIIMVAILVLILLASIVQFVKAYKKYVREKNAPSLPAATTMPASIEAPRAAERLRAAPMQPGSETGPSRDPGSTVTYSTSRGAAPQLTHIIEKEKVIIKEIVKIKCQWCGMLVDQGVSECPNCAGRM